LFLAGRPISRLGRDVRFFNRRSHDRRRFGHGCFHRRHFRCLLW
jgi:hypothetical protein